MLRKDRGLIVFENRIVVGIFGHSTERRLLEEGDNCTMRNVNIYVSFNNIKKIKSQK